MPADIAEGQLLGDRYRIGPFLGCGATSEVYSAVDLRLDRPVAVKFLRADLTGNAGSRRRFAAEARTAARMGHPHVVAVYDSADPEPPGRPYIVMELLSGPTLRGALAAGPLSEPAARDMAKQVLSALDAAARIGLVHCDIKPDNIVATGDGRWKVADFGTADRRCAPPGARTDAAGPAHTGAVTGTPAYLAPERVQGRPATAASDVFSFGVVLYEALAGRRPYDALGVHPWTSAAGGVRPVPIGRLRPGLAPDLAAAVDRAVEADPGRRFATPADMAAALGGHALDQAAVPAARPGAGFDPAWGQPVDLVGPDAGGPATMEVRVIGGRMAVPARTLAAAFRLAVGGGAAVAVALAVAFTLPGGSAAPAHAGPASAPGGAAVPAVVTGPAGAGTLFAVASPAAAPDAATATATASSPGPTTSATLVSADTPAPVSASPAVTRSTRGHVAHLPAPRPAHSRAAASKAAALPAATRPAVTRAPAGPAAVRPGPDRAGATPPGPAGRPR